MNPGRYNTRRRGSLRRHTQTAGERIVNEADVTYYPPGKDNIPHAVKLPDGYDTWAAAWGRGTTVLWVTKRACCGKLISPIPRRCRKRASRADNIASAPIPPDIREALRAALAVTDAPKPAAEDAESEASRTGTGDAEAGAAKAEGRGQSG